MSKLQTNNRITHGPPFDAKDSVFWFPAPHSTAAKPVALSPSNPAKVLMPRLTASSTLSSALGAANVASSSTSISQVRKLDLHFPAAFVDEQKKLTIIDGASSDSHRKFILQDLNVTRLNRIHKHLWFAVCQFAPGRCTTSYVLADRSSLLSKQTFIWSGRIALCSSNPCRSIS